MSPRIGGGGPAGSAAALWLARAGARPVVYEQSALPRHKVCGEFFSPEILPLFEQLGIAESFMSLRPAVVAFAELRFGSRRRRFRLPEPAWGLSRWTLDDWLLRHAASGGAEVRRERVAVSNCDIRAAGRAAALPRGRRAFGFKAHFAGPANDAVELHFFPGGYGGLCPIENGRTNVCGLVEEGMFRARRFDVDLLIQASAGLRERLTSLTRLTRWFTTGPLVFGPPASVGGSPAAGDAACFVDPFTGSGLLAAVQTGIWAGRAALAGPAAYSWYTQQCGPFYRRQLATTTIARRLLALGWAETLARFLPGAALFRLTRPAA